jgi:hypothetical protein
MTAFPLLDEAVALRWIESWDRQQTTYLPHRQEQFDVVAGLVAAVAGPRPRVLDLGCGAGRRRWGQLGVGSHVCSGVRRW